MPVPVCASLAAAGQSQWVPVGHLRSSFGIGLGATITSGATLTYKVQHTFDDPNQTRRLVTISRTTTTATVTDVDHRLSVGDSITVYGSGNPNLDGTFNVASVTNADTYTYTVANAGAAASVAPTYLISLRAFDHATVTGKTANTDGNYAYPVKAIRLVVTSYTSGKVDLQIL